MNEPVQHIVYVENQELEMLRTFYSRWKDLHTTARTEANRPVLELMAQNLVDAGHAVEACQKLGREVVLNG